MGGAFGEGTIDQSFCAAEASGMLPAPKAFGVSTAGCTRTGIGCVGELAEGVSGRNGMPVNPRGRIAGLLAEKTSGSLFRENSAPGGSGTPGGRRLALVP